MAGGLGVLACLTALPGQAEPAGGAAHEPAAGKSRVALEALQRLKGMDWEKNPSLKAAVDKVVAEARGTAEFIDIACALDLPDVDAEVLELAVQAGPGDARALAGVRRVLGRDRALVATRLAGATGPGAASLVGLLGNAGEPGAVELLAALAGDAQRPVDLRGGALRALVRSEVGARRVLDLHGQLDPGLQEVALAALRVAAWPDVQAEVSRRWPAGGGATLGELLSVSGDVARGGQVVARSACIACHKVGALGVDFGPSLSQIGGKLSREGLYEAIVAPAASISHGFEGVQVVLKSGGVRTGFIVSETASELAIKEASGVVSKVPVAEVERRVVLPGSLMPAGLERTLSAQELADMVAYLLSLK